MSRLDEALRALRQDVDGASPDAPRTLARVLARAEVKRRRTRFLAYFAAAAALVVTAAWAAVRSAPRGAEAPAESPSVAPVSSGAMSPALSASAEDVSPQASATALLAPSSAPAPSSALAPTVTPPAVGGAAPSARRDEAGRDSAELAAYERAHRAHFVEKDASSALRAWDGYLASYPRGSFAPEASYNRAICLLRLHREAEAKKALEPFARGTYGSYRQKEAQLLLTGLADAGH
jgi:TolA-binding protein